MVTAKPRPSGKTSTAQAQALPDKTFIIDNGAFNMKAGYAPESFPAGDEEAALAACTVIPNAIAKTRANRTYIGAQIGTNIADVNEMLFRRPLEKGYTVNWEAQKEIWESSFFDEKTVRAKEQRIADPEDVTIIFGEAPNALPALQKNADEIIMEEWGFGGYLRCVGKLTYPLVLSRSNLVFVSRPVAECLERGPIPIWRSCLNTIRPRCLSDGVPSRGRLRVFPYYRHTNLQGTAVTARRSKTRPWWETSDKLSQGACFYKAV